MKSNDSMYDACISNGYFMAQRNSSINTRTFMLELYHGEVILPKANEVRNFTCLHPPVRDDLLAMVT